jgi:hypothetical protein
MAAFLDAPVAAERGGGVPIGPVTYGGTVAEEDEAAEVRRNSLMVSALTVGVRNWGWWHTGAR